jgi:hypothetical protein
MREGGQWLLCFVWILFGFQWKNIFLHLVLFIFSLWCARSGRYFFSSSSAGHAGRLCVSWFPPLHKILLERAAPVQGFHFPQPVHPLTASYGSCCCFLEASLSSRELTASARPPVAGTALAFGPREKSSQLSVFIFFSLVDLSFPLAHNPFVGRFCFIPAAGAPSASRDLVVKLVGFSRYDYELESICEFLLVFKICFFMQYECMMSWNISAICVPHQKKISPNIDGIYIVGGKSHSSP